MADRVAGRDYAEVWAAICRRRLAGLDVEVPALDGQLELEDPPAEAGEPSP